MIIQVRGTSGSGKTWVMKEFMKGFEWEPNYKEGRKQPLYYSTFVNPDVEMVVLGHYETACGGCDTIGSCPKIFELIGDLSHCDVIVCEGLLLSEDVKWTSTIENELVGIVYLTTPIEECLSQIKDRRITAGNNKPLNEHNTRNRVGVIEKSKRRLKEFDHVIIRSAPSKQAPKILRRWIHG